MVNLSKLCDVRYDKRERRQMEQNPTAPFDEPLTYGNKSFRNER